MSWLAMATVGQFLGAVVVFLDKYIVTDDIEKIVESDKFENKEFETFCVSCKIENIIELPLIDLTK